MATTPHAQKDALSHVGDVASTVFVGRLPKGVDLNELYYIAAEPSQGLHLSVLKLVPSRATYLFIEYDNPSQAMAASDALNGYMMNGARIVVMPATQLR